MMLLPPDRLSVKTLLPDAAVPLLLSDAHPASLLAYFAFLCMIF